MVAISRTILDDTRAFRPKGYEVRELEEHGIMLNYDMYEWNVEKNETVIPSGTLEKIRKNWAVKGDTVLFKNSGGYESEPKRFLKILWEQGLISSHHEDTVMLTVKEVDIGRSSSTYSFEEILGLYNTVMFRKIENA